jgi:hypothetical protein
MAMHLLANLEPDPLVRCLPWFIPKISRHQHWWSGEGLLTVGKAEVRRD